MALSGTLTLLVRRMEEVVWARQEIKRFAAALPFTSDDLARIELAISELASNLVKHAKGGQLRAMRLQREGRWLLQVVATDHGPGIADLKQALNPGFSTAGSFGDGLSAVRELMDTFAITTEVGQWTRVEIEKWAR
jgi:serine/threonine-protein kinase RsbT